MKYAIVNENNVAIGVLDIDDAAHLDLIEVGGHRKVACADHTQAGDSVEAGAPSAPVVTDPVAPVVESPGYHEQNV